MVRQVPMIEQWSIADRSQSFERLLTGRAEDSSGSFRHNPGGATETPPCTWSLSMRSKVSPESGAFTVLRSIRWWAEALCFSIYNDSKGVQRLAGRGVDTAIS